MSRSYRKPYAAICGTGSAKDDKRHANRGVRRRQNQYLRDSRIANDYDGFIIPHKYECSFNETYSWGRDGKQNYHPAPRESDDLHGWTYWTFGPEEAAKSYQESLKRYEKLKRK